MTTKKVVWKFLLATNFFQITTRLLWVGTLNCVYCNFRLPRDDPASHILHSKILCSFQPFRVLHYYLSDLKHRFMNSRNNNSRLFLVFLGIGHFFYDQQKDRHNGTAKSATNTHFNPIGYFATIASNKDQSAMLIARSTVILNVSIKRSSPELNIFSNGINFVA